MEWNAKCKLEVKGQADAKELGLSKVPDIVCQDCQTTAPP